MKPLQARTVAKIERVLDSLDKDLLMAEVIKQVMEKAGVTEIQAWRYFHERTLEEGER